MGGGSSCDNILKQVIPPLCRDVPNNLQHSGHIYDTGKLAKSRDNT